MKGTSRTRDQLVGRNEAKRQTVKKNSKEPMRAAAVIRCLLREVDLTVVQHQQIFFFFFKFALPSPP